ncbi:MAG: thioredoxin family protein [Prevotella sp.]|jgi:thiol:disulfide interchange protein DsbD|nr:thioredoxin family protein [Prevotella sp.]
MRKTFVFLALLAVSIIGLHAQEPAEWSFSLVDKGNGEVELTANVKIDVAWHVFDVKVPDGGPLPTTISIEKLKGATKVGGLKTVNSKLRTKYDDIFKMEYGYYEDQATFVQRLNVTDKAAFVLEGVLRGQVCSEIDGQCIPIKEELNFTSKNLPASLVVASSSAGDAKVEETVAETAVTPTDVAPVDSIAQAPVEKGDLWAPVIDKMKPYGQEEETDQTYWVIFISGFLWGFVALVTPCVWPMIPMTVSFFLKRNKKSKKKAIQDAVTYGIGIIIIYVTLGLLITAIFGASALNNMATSAVFNLIFFALLVVFGISFLGAFELVLPSSWTNKMDQKADSTTGILSIFFMAFTLALVSFSCTGPLIGNLLVQAAGTGSIIAPALGMLGFALALALPFMLFAIFPSWLQSMPKSGGWLNSVKVVLGFAELALALKFFSVADLAYGWGILDREVFLVLWIAIFVLLGIYLLGKLKLPHDSDLKHVSVPRLFLAIISFAFAIYMVPGLWGAPLKAISAFSPPLKTQDFNLYKGEVHAAFDDYEIGMEYARKNNKPVLIDFSGYGCVNCRKMEAAVWTDPQVKEKIDNSYVLITLMVDDKKDLPEVIEVVENGKTGKLRTVGDKWSYLQRHKFGTNSQPYYVLLDSNGEPIGPFYVYKEDVPEYLDFLNIGLRNFKKAEETNMN